jgi:hypothetical protein
MEQMTRDRAQSILFDTYWSRAGWRQQPVVSPEDFAFARDAGYMFEPVHLAHDDVIRWLGTSFQEAMLEDIRNAFLASLSTRRLELRSALGSYAVARHLPVHALKGDGFRCTICGLFDHPYRRYDLSILNFERYKWGGVRHDHPEYVAFDLAQFAKLDRARPTQRDFDIMRQIVETARRCEPKARPRDLEKRLATVLTSNKAEREILIQILGYCGILQSSHHPGYFREFVNHADRTFPLERTYWTYPVIWWRGADGINQEALEYYFPELVEGG